MNDYFSKISLYALRKYFIGFLVVAFFASIYFITTLKFSFDFEQYFPQGDPDLEFFQTFIKQFESDDNYMLIGLKRTGGIFNQNFLAKLDALSNKVLEVPYVRESQSLTKTVLPVKSAFGVVPMPIFDINDSTQYAEAKERLTHDPRFVKNLISEDATATVVFVKTKERLSLPESEVMMHSIDSLVIPMGFESFHYLGRANFQKELVQMEKREVGVSTGVAAILVAIIMTLLFRRWQTVLLAMMSIGLSLLLFMGVLGAWGRSLSAISALYPVLMVIIGTSDFIHMLSKYIDELNLGHTKREAIWLTMKEIGLATFMTAITTAIGFATLTSRVLPIQEFGMNAAVGVMVAYVTVLLFTTAFLPFFTADQLEKARSGSTYVHQLMSWVYKTTKTRAVTIGLVILVISVISCVGVSKITTNYTIGNNMPRGEKVTADFVFFEHMFAGFRPLEFAVFCQGTHKVSDFDVVRQIDKVETYLSRQPAIRSVISPLIMVKSLNQMNNGNRAQAYVIPKDSSEYAAVQDIAKTLPRATSQVLISKDNTKARITTRILDLGADSVMQVGNRIDAWIAANTDTTITKFRRTGTGFIIDKNATYIRSDMLTGILWEVGIIAVLMGLMLRSIRMILIFLIPNLFPLLFAGALVGFLGVPLDAGISMIFTVIFGISIDDTIHFLSSFNINRKKNGGVSVDEALHTTLLETGKPVCLTTVILFFGFLVMVFSIHPPSVTIGKLIAVTLVSALASDLFINPILLRLWIKDDSEQGTRNREKGINADLQNANGVMLKA